MERSACPTCGSCSGMFTANSMNCLMEALGLALPGNGTVVATHADRKELFLEAGRRIVDLARRYYEQDDDGVLPRGIATFEAFENAMTLDIAMGGSTNTVLHLLAAAQEAGVPFTMRDIDRLSRRVPNICKVAPSSATVHVEDVHRAGGIFGILARAGPRRAARTAASPRCTAATMGEAIDRWDVAARHGPRGAALLLAPRPAASAPPSRSARARATRALDLDRETRRHPRHRARLQPRWRPGGALRQHRRRRLHREDRRRGSLPAWYSPARRAFSRARKTPSRVSSATTSSPATWW